MWIGFYNGTGVGDVVMLTNGKGTRHHVQYDRQDNVALVKDEDSQEVVAVNLFDVADELGVKDQVGQLDLSQAQVDKINQIIQQAGFDLNLAIDLSEKFVVGHVESCQPHPDSDHLSITQTNVGDKVLQIVCGASNIAQGLDVIVAKPGAMMPSGMLIFPGELRGEKSEGMICSTRELGLENIENYPGIWELKKGFAAGTPLKDVVAAYK